MTKAYKITIKGRVTGVGFRYSTVYYAKTLPTLTGYIRNADSSCVEAVIQGSNEDLTHMISFLRSGPPMSRVDEFYINEVPVEPDYKDFSVK